MRLFDVLRLNKPELAPEQAKIHLACWNGHEEPLDKYVAGTFDEWQRWQRKRNFERPLVVSLISMPARHRWLFAGVHVARGSRFDETKGYHYYALEEDPAYADLNGRIVVRFRRTGRQSYLLADKWADALMVSEIRPERLTIGTFPGYRAIDLSYDQLEHIVREAPASWRTALSAVGGVYLISDTASGRLYVGSGTGEGGIWQRWCDYAKSGHGGNVDLRDLLDQEGRERLQALRYSVLEIADTHTSVPDVLQREAHWKNVLLARAFGLNAN